MKTLFFVLGCVLLASGLRAEEPRNSLRGYTEINRILKERIAQNNGFELGQYLSEDNSVPTNGGLLSLLGTFVGSDTTASYRNGEANSVNMLLWYIALNSLAQDIGSNCAQLPAEKHVSSVSPLFLRATFRKALDPICAWPAVQAKSDDALYGFWSALLGYDAPQDEFQSWKNYFLTDPAFDQESVSKVVAAMTVAALYNPYFLLSD